jgi:hypothetical protein
LLAPRVDTDWATLERPRDTSMHSRPPDAGEAVIRHAELVDSYLIVSAKKRASQRKAPRARGRSCTEWRQHVASGTVVVATILRLWYLSYL